MSFPTVQDLLLLLLDLPELLDEVVLVFVVDDLVLGAFARFEAGQVWNWVNLSFETLEKTVVNFLFLQFLLLFLDFQFFALHFQLLLHIHGTNNLK